MADLQEAVSLALDQLRTETAGPTRARRCVSAAVFWKAALGVRKLQDRDESHLRECTDCRRRAEEVRAAVQERKPASGDLPRSYLSDRPLQPSRARTTDGYPGPQDLRFAADPDLALHIRRQRDGVWLHVEHPRWPAGTLVRLTVGAPDGRSSWSIFLLLGTSGARHRLSKPLLLDQQPRPVCIERTTAAQLRDSDASGLREAQRLAARDDPAAPWANWAREAAAIGTLPTSLRAVLREIARSTTQPPSAGLR